MMKIMKFRRGHEWEVVTTVMNGWYKCSDYVPDPGGGYVGTNQNWR